MAVYRYIAAETGGAQRRGELSADSAYQVRLALRRMGLAPLRVAEAPGAGGEKRSALRIVISRTGRGRRRAQLIELYEGLAALLASGCALAPSLELLARSGASGRAAATLCHALSERIRQGRSLAAAMAERTEWFSAVDTALVRSAEESGEAERALADLAEHHGRAGQLRGRLAGALAYPALLFVFGLAVVIFLTTNTLPQLVGALRDGGAPVPAPTRALLAFGEALAAHWMIAALGAVGFFALLLWAGRATRLARLRLRVPLAGRLVARSQTASASLLLARLLRAGLPLTEALALAAPTVPNAALRDALENLGERLKAGRTVAGALSESGLFDPVFLRVLEIGEESGELPSSLERIGTRYRAASARLVDRLAAALEPAVILILAALIGFVVYAAIAPMLALAGTL